MREPGGTPASLSARRRANGKLHARYVVSDRGPRERVAVEWVPQLQLQMLCAGTPSALLASRSATKGIRVFRVARDDVYLRQMLAVASRLWTAHVLLHRPPPADVYASMPEYGAFLQRTVQAGASCARAGRGHSRGTDARRTALEPAPPTAAADCAQRRSCGSRCRLRNCAPRRQEAIPGLILGLVPW
jgi:hypothetical protein